MKHETSASDCRSFLFDTNAVLDLMGSQELRPRKWEVARLVTNCFHDGVNMYVSIASLKDVFYIVRRAESQTEAFNQVAAAMRIFEPIDLKAEHAHMALVSGEPDFEDGLIRAQAEDLGVDAIVTDDRKAFAASPIPHLSAAECLLTFWPEAIRSDE